MSDIVEKKLAKKLKLLNAAEELFAQKGVNITAIDDIVKKAGIAKGTFYLYFKDKYDLLDQIIIYKSEGVIRDAIERCQKSDKKFTDRVFLFTDYIIDYFKKNRKMLLIIQKNLSSCIRMMVSGDGIDENGILSPVLKDFSDNGFDTEETSKLMYIITSTVSSVCCDAILFEKPYGIDELRPQIHMMIESLLKGGKCNDI